MRNIERHNITVSGIPVLVAPVSPAVQEDTKSADLRVVVLYRTPEATREALRYAAKLGDGLSANLRLVEIEVVPYPCPLDRPTIDPGFARRRLETLVQESGALIRAELVYARDRDEALERLLGSASLVLIPVNGLWQRIREKRLVRKLIKHGHDVILVPCK